MGVIDASGVLALLRDEPGAEPVAGLVRARRVDFTSVGLAEAIDHLVRTAGATPAAAVVGIASLGLPIHALTPAIAVEAGALRAGHYHRRRRPVSMADCVVAATGLVRRTWVASSDRHLLELCIDEGIDVVALPDSSGAVWEPSVDE